ncbi:MAG: hypothetical protein ACREEA_05605, partial [Stellaceae bacterium]
MDDRVIIAGAPAHGVEIRGPLKPGYEKILTQEAIAFVASLERRFGAERQ